MRRFWKTTVIFVFLLSWGCGDVTGADDTDNDTGTGTVTDSDTGTGTDTSSDTGTGTDTSSDTGTGTDTSSDTGTGTDTSSDTGTGTDTDTDSDTGTGTDTDSDTGTGTDTDSDTGTGTDTDSDTGTGTDTDSDTGTGTDTDTHTDTDTDTDSDTDSDTVWEDPRCVDLSDVEFNEACPTILGFAVKSDSCNDVIGCDPMGYELFETEEECFAACPTKYEACIDAGGTWDVASKGGDYLCGQPPACPDNDCTGLPAIAGCNCGTGKRYDDALGCVDEPSCVAPSCDDTVDFEFGYGDCIATLGWMVRDGSCQLVKGCPNLDYGFYATRDDCNAACNTPQRLCMESGGAWLGTDSFNPAKSVFYYDCGNKVVSTGPNVVPCNCGLEKNYVAGVGCQDDSNCTPVNTTCPNYDFNVDYTPSCSPTMPLVGHYGLVAGACSTIFGCLADFEGPDAFVDPSTWFVTEDQCRAACEPRCFSNDDCVDPDPADEYGIYCHFDKDSNCGALTNGGTCEASGGSCTMVDDPVCGCDGDSVSSEACIGPRGRPMRHEGHCFEFPPLNP